MNVRIFITREKPLEMIMIQSVFKKPYQTQSESPEKSTASIPMETFSAFFSFNNLKNWGSREVPVPMLAAIPIIVVVSIKQIFNTMLISYQLTNTILLS